MYVYQVPKIHYILFGVHKFPHLTDCNMVRCLLTCTCGSMNSILVIYFKRYLTTLPTADKLQVDSRDILKTIFQRKKLHSFDDAITYTLLPAAAAAAVGGARQS